MQSRSSGAELEKEKKATSFFFCCVRFALNDNLTLSWTRESNDLVAHFFSSYVSIGVRISYPIKAIHLCRLGDETFLFHMNFICCMAVFSIDRSRPMELSIECASGSSSYNFMEHRIISHDNVARYAVRATWATHSIATCVWHFHWSITVSHCLCLSA